MPILDTPEPVTTTVRSDADLLAAHKAGDPHAFTELARRHQPRLWGLAATILRNRDDVADAVQDTLLAAFRTAPGFRGQAAVSTWLSRILVNTCIDRIRASRRVATLTVSALSADRPDVMDVSTHATNRLPIQQALAALPEVQRAAVLLVDLHDWPVHKAAAALRVPVGTVKSRCARGRARLAELLHDLHTDR